MRLHEYQAKSLLALYGMLVPSGGLASRSEEAGDIAQRLGGRCVVKAQVHAGGRARGGGVLFVDSAQEAEEKAEALLGARLVTPQTGPRGVPVSRVLVEERLEVERELYLGLLVDGSAQSVVMIASGVGGVSIEEMAQESPDQVLTERIDPGLGLQAYQGRRLALRIGLPSTLIRFAADQMLRLHEVFAAKDCSLVEINPLVVTRDQRLVVLDAKISLDDAALFRHSDMASLRDWSQEDPLDAQAIQANISYVRLEGDVGCLVNGAGLAMATLDTLAAAGQAPANFLDIGGGANPEQVAQAVAILLADTRVRAMLVNVFAGISRCDEIARGIVQGVSPERRGVPLVVRLLGTNVEEGIAVLQESGLRVHPISSLAEAAQALERVERG